MGVFGLTKFLNINRDVVSERIEIEARSGAEREKSIVLVDGFGFIISLIEAVIHPLSTLDFGGDDQQFESCLNADFIGGDLDSVSRATRRVVEMLYNVYDIKLVFLIDNDHQTQVKPDASEKLDPATAFHIFQDKQRKLVKFQRFEERRRKLENFYDYCDNKAPFFPKKDGHTDLLPPLAMDEVFRTLGRLPNNMVSVVNVPGEVDSYIRFYQFSFKPAFILTSDSDFAIVEGSRFAFIHEFPFREILVAAKTHDVQPLELYIYSNEKLRNYLSLDIKQLALVATLTGNDYTKDLLGGNDFLMTSHKIKRKEPVDQKILNHEAVVTSQKQYLYYIEPDKADVDYLKKIPRGLFTMFRYKYYSENLEYVYMRVMGFFGDLSSFKRVRTLQAALLGLPTLSIEKEGESEIVVVPVDFPRDVKENSGRWCVSYSKWREFCEEEKMDGLAQLFQRPPASALWKLSAERGTVLQLFTMEMILWTVQSALNKIQELKLFIVVMLLSRALGRPFDRPAALNLVKYLQGVADNNDAVPVVEARPSVRLMQLSSIFAKGYHMVTDIYELIGLDFDFFPSQFFSGTLLQTVVRLGWTQFHNLDDWKEKINKCPSDSAKNLWNENIVKYMDVILHRLGVPLANSAVPHTEPAPKEGLKLLAPSRDLKEHYSRENVKKEKPISYTGILTNEHDICDEIEGDLNVNKPKELKPTKGKGKRTYDIQVASPLDDDIEEFPSSQPTAAETVLPAELHREEVLSALQEHRVVCIQGDTGCGKSSVVPKMILEDCRKRHKRAFIVVTQPRRIAATSLASRVASTLGEEVGHSVGYRLGGGIRCENKGSRKSQLLYVTTGYLLELLAHGGENFFSKITHLILDEVHERSIQADMLSLVTKVMFSKQTDNQNDDFGDSGYFASSWAKEDASRLIIMSATISANMFIDYFSPVGWSEAAPLIAVGVKRFHVEVTYVDDLLKKQGNLIKKKAGDKVLNDLKSLEELCNPFRKQVNISTKHVIAIKHLIYFHMRPGTCVLVFAPGQDEIEKIFNELEADKQSLPMNARIHPLHSMVEREDQDKALVPAAANECKIVIATNIAETSLTIPDVKIVIDLGLARHVGYDKDTDMRVLRLERCSQASAKQRAGRSGRVSEGQVIRLYSEQIFEDMMKPFDDAEIYPLEYSVLLLRQCLYEYGDIQEVMSKLIEAPSVEEVEIAIDKLIAWGALDEKSLQVLELGRLAVRFPIDVSLTRAVLNAIPFGCATEMMVIACGLTLPKNLIRRFYKYHYKSHKEFQNDSIPALKIQALFDAGRRNDLFIMLSLYEQGQFQTLFDEKRSNFVWDNHLSSPQVKLFRSSVRRLGSILLESCGGQLVESDRALLRSIVNWKDFEGEKPVEERKKLKLTFPCLHNANTAFYMLLLLAQASQLTIIGENKMVEQKKKPQQKKKGKQIETESEEDDNEEAEEKQVTAENDPYTFGMTVPSNTLGKGNPASNNVINYNVGEKFPLTSYLSNFGPFKRICVYGNQPVGSAPVQVTISLVPDPTETWFTSKTAQSRFKHPTAVPAKLYALSAFFAITKTKENRGVLGKEGSEESESFPFPRAAAKLTFAGFKPTLGITCHNVISKDRARFSNWSVISEISAYSQPQDFVAFGFGLMKMDKGPTFVDYGFMPHFPLSDSTNDEAFPLIALLVANPPEANSTIRLGDMLKKKHSYIFDTIRYSSIPVGNLMSCIALKKLDLEQIILILCEVNVILFMMFSRQLGSTHKVFQQLEQLLKEVRQIRHTYSSMGFMRNLIVDKQLYKECIPMRVRTIVNIQSKENVEVKCRLWNIFNFSTTEIPETTKGKGKNKKNQEKFNSFNLDAEDDEEDDGAKTVSQQEAQKFNDARRRHMIGFFKKFAELIDDHDFAEFPLEQPFDSSDEEDITSDDELLW